MMLPAAAMCQKDAGSRVFLAVCSREFDASQTCPSSGVAPEPRRGAGTRAMTTEGDSLPAHARGTSVVQTQVRLRSDSNRIEVRRPRLEGGSPEPELGADTGRPTHFRHTVVALPWFRLRSDSGQSRVR